MGAFRVIEPGMLTTVQDLGRPGHGAIGVVRGGAADTLSLRVGNRLVGNGDDAPALEMTMLGGSFAFEHDAVLAITGGETASKIEGPGGVRVVPRTHPVTIRTGERLVVGPITRGVRTYLCVSGGLNVPRVLGSASTHLGAAFGGHHGRALRGGDPLEFGNPVGPPVDEAVAACAARLIDGILSQRVLRAVDGAHIGLFDARAVREFWSRPFTVSSRSDRVGVRLAGSIPAGSATGAMPSEGMMFGAVQAPPVGEPIVLMADYPTTGGYPVVACVATVDLPVLGQLRPGDEVRFERITLQGARELFRRREQELVEPEDPKIEDLV